MMRKTITISISILFVAVLYIWWGSWYSNYSMCSRMVNLTTIENKRDLEKWLNEKLLPSKFLDDKENLDKVILFTENKDIPKINYSSFDLDEFYASIMFGLTTVDDRSEHQLVIRLGEGRRYYAEFTAKKNDMRNTGYKLMTEKTICGS